MKKPAEHLRRFFPTGPQTPELLKPGDCPLHGPMPQHVENDAITYWTSAGNAELEGAATRLDDFEEPVQAFIRSELARRGLCVPVAEQTHTLEPLKLKHLLVRYADPPAARALLAALAAVGVGVLRDAPFVQKYPGAPSVVSIVLLAVSVVVLNYLVTKYAQGAILALASSIGIVGYTVIMCIMIRAPMLEMYGARYFLTLGTLLGWLILAAISCGAVFVRLRFWPLYPSGHCRVCGYDLTGLPEPRCPECGTAFGAGRPYTRTNGT